MDNNWRKNRKRKNQQARGNDRTVKSKNDPWNTELAEKNNTKNKTVTNEKKQKGKNKIKN